MIVSLLLLKVLCIRHIFSIHYWWRAAVFLLCKLSKIDSLHAKHRHSSMTVSVMCIKFYLLIWMILNNIRAEIGYHCFLKCNWSFFVLVDLVKPGSFPWYLLLFYSVWGRIRKRRNTLRTRLNLKLKMMISLKLHFLKWFEKLVHISLIWIKHKERQRSYRLNM